MHLVIPINNYDLRMDKNIKQTFCRKIDTTYNILCLAYYNPLKRCEALFDQLYTNNERQRESYF